jgi:hypothetical protein
MIEETYSEFTLSAIECARYIFDSDGEQISYQEYIQDGNDPKDHILYHAAVVLGLVGEFESDIAEYENSIRVDN